MTLWGAPMNGLSFCNIHEPSELIQTIPFALELCPLLLHSPVLSSSGRDESTAKPGGTQGIELSPGWCQALWPRIVHLVCATWEAGKTLKSNHGQNPRDSPDWEMGDSVSSGPSVPPILGLHSRYFQVPLGQWQQLRVTG